MITPTDTKSRAAYIMTPPRDLSLFVAAGGIDRVVGTSTAPYPDLEVVGARVGEGGGELTANSHMINPSHSLLVPSSIPDNDAA